MRDPRVYSSHDGQQTVASIFQSRNRSFWGLTMLIMLAAMGTAKAALTGLALPPLDVPVAQYGGSWASAYTLVFTDLMKHSTPFTAGSRYAGSSASFGYLSPSSITWRPDGYPAGLSPPAGQQWCAATTIGQGGAHYPAGRYVVLYEGNGTLELDGDAATPPLSSAAGRLEVQLAPNNTGIRLRITSSAAANPLRNVRIVPAAFEADYTSQPFHPAFLALIKGVPLLRFSAWMRASSNSGSGRTAPRDWAARTTPAHASQVREADGVAVEHLVQLANTANASMWISLPRAANDSDAYVYGMVSYIAANLSPRLNVTLEYGSEGPGWISSHLPTNTQLLAGIARRAWAAAGRGREQLRVVESAPHVIGVQNMLTNLPSNATSWLDALALPASFGGSAYWSWAGRDNPTSWGEPGFFATQRPNLTIEDALQRVRSSVIAADVAYNKQFQMLRGRGLAVLGYAAGPELQGPLYGSRANWDRVAVACGPPPAATVWPCSFSGPYPPWSSAGVPASVTWPDLAARNATLYGSLAANASREAAMESLQRQVRLHDKMYDMMLDSLWRWHSQMGGGDLVVDLTRLTLPCNSAPGVKSGSLYNPEECRNGTSVTAVANPDTTPVYKALKAWLAVSAAARVAGVGALPRSSAEGTPAVAPPKACKAGCVYGSCSYNGTCECWVGASGSNCSVLQSASTPSACNPRVGINLEGIVDYARSWTFVDAFKASRQWIPQNMIAGPWDTGANVSLLTASSPAGPTAAGYPGALGPDQKLSTLVLRDLQGHAPAGVYTVLYDGKGSLDFSMADVKDVTHVEAGHVKVTFAPSTDMNNGILVMLERTDPSDPLRNIRVLMPGFEQAAAAGSPFHPALLDFLRPFGLIRFMGWMRTNEAVQPVNWADRPRMEDRSYAVTPGGVPLELMVQLANRMGADPWFNMPHTASDEYVAAFAKAVRDTLRPDLKVYVEYSNELWHTGFPGGRYAQSQGLAMNLTEQGNSWYGGAVNEARLCFAGQRTANISKIWKTTWGATQAKRVVVVVSGQGVWPITSAKLLSCGGAAANIDALTIAPYFGSYNKTRDTNLTVLLNSSMPRQLNETLAFVVQHAAIAASYGKPLVAYEAGQDLIGDGSSTDLAIQANRHPGMGDLYRTYLTGLAAANVSRVVHFSSIGAFSQYGSWGLLEFQDSDKRDAPKYQAVLSYLNSSRVCALPSPPPAASCPGPGCRGNGDCLPGGTCQCYSGYSGADCSQAAYTEVYNCAYKCTFDQGWCNVSSTYRTTRTWGCTCKPGITGLTCSIVACPNNCSWNGECLDQGVCACYPGYSGSDCSTDCGCGGHGRCDGSGGCVCDVGWRRAANGTACVWDCSGCDSGAACIGPGECGCTETCKYGNCVAGRCRCWAGYGGAACNISDADSASLGNSSSSGNVSFVPRVNRGSLAGINLAGLSYYSDEWVWVDVMKGSSRWFTANAADTSLENPWDTGVPLDLRSDGYPARLPPGTVAHKLLLRDVQLHAWPGRYVVLYDGDGRLEFGFDAKVTSRAKGRIEILLTPTANLACAATFTAYCSDNGIHLSLTATNPANPLRNIRILPSADGAAASAGGPGAGGAWESRASRLPFHPWFLRSLARYSTIRFMPWQATNSNSTWVSGQNGTTSWARRTRVDQDTQAREDGGGTALEYMVGLCNMVGADPWVSVHHLADDAYVAAMAAALRDGLRPDVRVVLEHSNEVWNPLFSQNAYARSRGLALNLSTDPVIAGYRYHARRTAEIAAIFRTAFASAPGGGSARVKVVLGGWGYLCNGGKGCGAVVINETLGWNGTAAKVDYYGVDGYWDCGLGANGATDSLLSLEQMIAKCDAALATRQAAAVALAAAAAPYNVTLITYEAGPSLVESSAIASGAVTESLTPKLIALGRNPAMYRMYGSYLEALRSAGLVGEGRPWMAFASTALPGKYGSWGLQEYTGQDPASAPKYRALMDWLDKERPTGRRPTCLDLRASGGPAAGVSGSAGGGMWLGEGRLLGPPAVQLPAAGQVLVQGRTYTARWATVGWAAGASRPLNVSLWFDSDCGQDTAAGQLPASQALAVLASDAALTPAGELAWRVPLPAELPALTEAVAEAGSGAVRREARFFLRISDGSTTNYSEPFDIQPPYVYVAGAWGPCNASAKPSPLQTRNLSCVSNAAASSSPPDPAPPATAPFCAAYPGWNISAPPAVGDPTCSIDAVTGCRTYRTSNTGGWAYSLGKPVIDCIAQSSPWPAENATTPSSSSGTSSSSTLGAAVPLSFCEDAGLPAPASTRVCVPSPPPPKPPVPPPTASQLKPPLSSASPPAKAPAPSPPAANSPPPTGSTKPPPLLSPKPPIPRSPSPPPPPSPKPPSPPPPPSPKPPSPPPPPSPKPPSPGSSNSPPPRPKPAPPPKA